MANEFSSKELLEAIYDIRERVTRIEEKVNRTESWVDKVDEIEDRSTTALIKAQSNEKEIANMKANMKWAWGFVITLVLYVLMEYLKQGQGV